MEKSSPRSVTVYCVVDPGPLRIPQERRVAARSIQKPFQHPLHLRLEAADTAVTFAQISRHIVLAPRRSNRCT